MKRIISTSLLSLIAFSCFSQQKNYSNSYSQAIGLKIFDGAGITYKQFIAPTKALEGIAFFWQRGTRITGLYEWHQDIEGVSNLKWYVGPGIHVGFYNSDYGGDAFGGIDGVLGLDYKINEAPINLSLDWQPSFEFGYKRGFYGNWGGLGIRYTF